MRNVGAGGVLLAFWFLSSATGQPRAQATVPAGADEPVAVSTDHPRLFLRPQRLRLLTRERERTSVRWQQFDGFLAGEAPMPEPGFAEALYYQVSGNTAAGQRAVAWALGPGDDVRQLALVFDWCQKLLSESQRRALAARLQQRMAATESDESIPAVRARVLAAVALFDHVPDIPNRELERVVRNWWGAKMAPSFAAGQNVVPREDAYALFEMLHALRDSTNIDLRESSPRFFKTFPIEHLMSYYPAAFRGEDNDFRVGVSEKPGEPDLQQATLSRAADLAMVAYDTNSEENQYLQGWLMHDNFMLRSTLGAPYEFLWANPYQPGLSFTLLPLIFHNAESGRLFVRSDWDDDAEWFGYFDGAAQLFRDGRRAVLHVAGANAPITFPSAVIYLGASGMKFRLTLNEDQGAVILAGLSPHHTYQVEIDDEEVFEETTDPAGILVLDLVRGKEVGVRLKAPLAAVTAQ
jgi:hypothetical protein